MAAVRRVDVSDGYARGSRLDSAADRSTGMPGRRRGGVGRELGWAGSELSDGWSPGNLGARRMARTD